MTDHQSEWTDWFLHDGKGCPCVGQMVEVVRANGEVNGPFIAMTLTSTMSGKIVSASPFAVNSWDMDAMVSSGMGLAAVVRYRIRRPRALLDLIQLIADLPAPTQPMKTDGVIA